MMTKVIYTAPEGVESLIEDRPPCILTYDFKKLDFLKSCDYRVFTPQVNTNLYGCVVARDVKLVIAVDMSYSKKFYRPAYVKPQTLEELIYDLKDRYAIIKNIHTVQTSLHSYILRVRYGGRMHWGQRYIRRSILTRTPHPQPHKTFMRTFTVRELLRLDGYPDTYDIDIETNALQTLNAILRVPPPRLVRHFVQHLEDSLMS